jgi:HNH endonuclease
VRYRRCFYPSQEIEISDIDDVRNGMLLRKDLHAELGLCEMAFLRVCDKMRSRNVLFILGFLDPKPFS